MSGTTQERNDLPEMHSFPMSIAMSSNVRRLPIYLLLDCSDSMEGAPIAAVRRGLAHFTDDVKADSQARQNVYVCVIVFSSRQRTRNITNGLIHIRDFQMPELTTYGKTFFGAAFEKLIESLDNDIRKIKPGERLGDYKPLVFILTDGYPSEEDNWQEPRQRLLDRHAKLVGNIVTVGCGPQVDVEKLREICMGDAFLLSNPETSFFRFFQWVTQSVVQASQQVSRNRPAEILPPPPDAVIIARQEDMPPMPSDALPLPQ